MNDKQREFIKKLMNTGKAIAPPLVTIGVYEGMFGKRITSYEPYAFKIEDFENLYRERYVFETNNSNHLVGYMYQYPNIEKKAIIVFAHGYGGGGQRTYMDVISTLAKGGFYVFAYDATANDESEGTSLNGFPQGVIDLDNAIKFVETLNNFNKLPILLCGHSWGAYCVSNVLQFHPEVKAVCAFSGFNKSTDFIKSHATQFSGDKAPELISLVDPYEEYIFGNLAKSSAVENFKNSKANIFIVHSGDDQTVFYEVGYKIYYEQFKDNPRFTFRLFEDRGHASVYYTKEGINYTQEFEKQVNKFCKEFHQKPEGRAKYIIQHLDRKRWADRINHPLFDEIINFYNNSLK